ncbi:hypothetical protein GGD66_006968 [Bradyrhizobium sp. CIR48]|nr:hypothetical protein [Bradyrhizobium sp. CIR48]MBB4428381.1 hypothetical protein [Bradyrhizobium sp. CIR48]
MKKKILAIDGDAGAWAEPSCSIAKSFLADGSVVTIQEPPQPRAEIG